MFYVETCLSIFWMGILSMEHPKIYLNDWKKCFVTLYILSFFEFRQANSLANFTFNCTCQHNISTVWAPYFPFLSKQLTLILNKLLSQKRKIWCSNCWCMAPIIFKICQLIVKGVVNCQNSRDKGPPEGNSAVGTPRPYSIIILNMRFIPKALLRASSQIILYAWATSMS